MYVQKPKKYPQISNCLPFLNAVLEQLLLLLPTIQVAITGLHKHMYHYLPIVFMFDWSFCLYMWVFSPLMRFCFHFFKKTIHIELTLATWWIKWGEVGSQNYREESYCTYAFCSRTRNWERHCEHCNGVPNWW